MPTSALFSELTESVAPFAGDAPILAAPFLDTCRLVLPVIDSLGTAFIPARADVGGNIERLAARVAATGGASISLFDIVAAEIADGTAAGNSSCTKGLLWLKRFLEFTLRLLERLAQNADGELGDAARDAYEKTLRPFHGYLTQAVFTAVLYATPYRATFEAALLKHNAAAGEEASPAPEASSQALADDMAQFVAAFGPVLARIHTHLADAGQDDPSRV